MTGFEVAILTHNDTHCGHAPCRPPLIAIQGVGVLLGEESTMRLLHSGLNGSGYDYDSQVHGCRVEEHSLVGKMTLDFKKKKCTFLFPVLVKV